MRSLVIFVITVVWILANCSRSSTSEQTISQVPSAELIATCETSNILEPPIMPNYWTAGTFHDLLHSAYSLQLCAMGEPVLSKPGAGKVRFRFIWLRTFHPGIAIRIEHDFSHTKLIATKLSGAGGQSPGKVERQFDRTLSPKEWSSIQRLISESGFWNLPTSGQSFGLDGSQWIIEVAESNRYHVVDRWNGGPLESLGRQLLTFSQLDPKPIY